MSCSKKHASSSSLPEDILVQILSKLPAKCLVRFRYPPRQSDKDDIFIHNLSTRRHISLPTTCIAPLSSTDHRMNACGLLGFDSLSRRYKVLKSVQFTDHKDCHVTVKHWVFTLGLDKSWREIDDCYPSFHPYNITNHSFYFSTSVHIDGVIYSLNFLNKRDDCTKFHIVAFDVAAENFRTIPSPPPYDPLPYNVTTGLIEVEGRVAIVDTDKRGMCYYMRIWTLEEESMVWKKMDIIPIPIPSKDCQSGSFNHTNLFFFSTNHIGEKI